MAKTFKANFNRAIRFPVVIPLADATGKLVPHEMEMAARLITASEYEAFTEATFKGDVLKDHVTEPPQIVDEDTDKAFTLEELNDVVYIRDAMYARLVDISFNPDAARGN